MNPLSALLAASLLALPASAQNDDLNKAIPIEFQKAAADNTHVASQKPKTWQEPTSDSVEVPRSLQWTLLMAGKPASAQDYDHVILIDADVRDENGDVDFGMRKRWRLQSQSLKSQLIARGTPAERINIVSLYSVDDLRIPFEASTKPKIVYVFSHANSYEIEFNIGTIDFRKKGRVEFFLKNNVQALIVYGCSFLAPDPEAQKIFAEAMGNRTLVLVGHEKPSDGRDDSEFHPENPLYVEEMGRECPIRKVSRCERKGAAAAATPLFPLSAKCEPK